MDNVDQIPACELEFIINDQLFLEVLLMEIRGEMIRFTKERNKNNKQRENNLEEDIQNLEKELSESKDIDSRNLSDNIDRKKWELEEIRRQKIEGVLLRSRARWVEYGEKPTS